jgi:hypothetical protein
LALWFCLDVNNTVVLVAAFLHKAPLPAYQRGFFCGDTTIDLPYKNSTVPTLVLIGVGFAVPVVSVSPG